MADANLKLNISVQILKHHNFRNSWSNELKICTTAVVSNRCHCYKFQENLRGWFHEYPCFKWN